MSIIRILAVNLVRAKFVTENVEAKDAFLSWFVDLWPLLFWLSTFYGFGTHSKSFIEAACFNFGNYSITNLHL